MRILHLSDTTLSGSPIRIVDVINKYTYHEARHLVWQPVFEYRKFKTDLVGESMALDELYSWLEWADILHFHNWYNKSKILQALGIKPPINPTVVQMHSPRRSNIFDSDDKSRAKLAIVAQYHVREWPELDFIVPNVVDFTAPEYQRNKAYSKERPIVSYAPSNCVCGGWDNKGYNHVAPLLKRLNIKRTLAYDPIIRRPHDRAMELKARADLGIDEFMTGSYHLSGLEYLALGVGCFGYIDELTERVIRDLTGCGEALPWIQVNSDTFKGKLLQIVRSKSWSIHGEESRRWIEKYWHPKFLAKCYADMYESL